MTRTYWMVMAAAMLAILPLNAQRVQTRQANIRGGGGDRGKCTIEVDVDDVAEVEFSGDTGRIVTISGLPAFFRRIDCTAPMPRNPYDFRFSGVDGRGRQTLIRDPGRSGVAVVRIEDPKGGREGYTFDLEWRGGGDYDRPPYGDRGGIGGWNREMTYRGRGDGYYRSSRGDRDRIFDCNVTISRCGDVSVTFQTDRDYGITLNGRVVRMDGDRVIADMSGNGIRGSMVISIDRSRVRDITMDGAGRERFELRWRD